MAIALYGVSAGDAVDSVNVTGHSGLPDMVSSDVHHHELVQEDHHTHKQSHPQLTEESHYQKHLQEDG